MEWHWCGLDGDCLASWFWSPATAAWVQAIASIILVIVTITLWRHDRAANVRSAMSQIHRNIVLIKASIGICEIALKRVRTDLSVPQFGVAQKTIEKMEQELLDALKAGLPNVEMMAYVQGRIARMLEIREWLGMAPGKITLSLSGDDQFARRKLRIALDTELDKFITEMTVAHDKIQNFHERYEINSLTPWNEDREVVTPVGLLQRIFSWVTQRQ